MIDCLVDFIEEGFDVVVCFGWVGDVCLIVWLLVVLCWVMVVLLEYLCSYGMLECLE